jgi:hypothetical protein
MVYYTVYVKYFLQIKKAEIKKYMNSIIKLTDYFDALGVSINHKTEELKTEELKTAFRNFLTSNHPDKVQKNQIEDKKDLFQYILEIRNELENNESILHQEYKNLFVVNEEKVKTVVQAWKQKFGVYSTEYSEHVEAVQRIWKESDEIGSSDNLPSLVRLLIKYLIDLKEKKPKFVKRTIKEMMHERTEDEKRSFILKIVDYCDTLELEVDKIQSPSYIEEKLRTRNERQEFDSIRNLLVNRHTLFKESTEVTKDNISRFIDAFKEKYDYKSETYVQMENLIEEKLLLDSSTTTSYIPFLCQLLIRYLSSLKSKKEKKEKKEILDKLSENFSPMEVFEPNRVKPSSSSSSLSPSEKSIQTPKTTMCKEKTTKYYGKGQCLTSNAFMKEVQDTLIKNRDLEGELERGLRVIASGNNGKIDNTPDVQNLLDSGLLSENSTLFLKSMLKPTFSSSNKTSSSTSSKCKSGYTRILTKDNVKRCVSLDTFLKIMEGKSNDEELLKGLKELANPKIKDSSLLKQILEKVSPETRQEIEEMILFKSNGNSSRPTLKTPKESSSPSQQSPCKNLDNRRVDGVCRDLQSLLIQLRKRFKAGEDKFVLFEKIMEVLDIFSRGDRDNKVDYLFVIRDLANEYAKVDVVKSKAILGKMRKKLGKSKKLTKSLDKDDDDSVSESPRTHISSSPSQQSPCKNLDNRRVDGVCRDLQSLLIQLRKRFKAGEDKSVLFEKIMEVLDIFSRGDRDNKVDYLFVIRDLANEYAKVDVVKSKAILGKMRKKLGKKQTLKKNFLHQ